MEIQKLKTRITEQQSVHLPEEIIEDILWRLPVKALLTLRCVSKSWLYLIGSERFIKSHLQFSEKNEGRVLVISGGSKLKHCFLQSVLNEAITSPQLTCPPCFNRRLVEVVGYCNGLVCISSSPAEHLYFWNPSTRIFKELPIDVSRLRSYGIAMGFGWDESSGAYKVCVFCRRWKECRVYSSKTNSWKAVDMGRDVRRVICKRGMFLNGKVHWPRGRRGHNRDVVTLDLKSEVFGEIEMPCDCDPAWSLGVLGGCLCVLSTDYRKKYLNVWVMKDESWLKIITAVPLVVVPHNIHITAAEAAPNGDILLIFGSGFLVYNPEENPLKEVKAFYNAHLCVESLVSPWGDE